MAEEGGSYVECGLFITSEPHLLMVVDPLLPVVKHPPLLHRS